MLTDDIGGAVRTARDRRGISLTELARQTAIDATMLQAIEAGDLLPSTAKLNRVADALGLDTFSLYEGRVVDRPLVALPRYSTYSDFQHTDLTIFRQALEHGTLLSDLSRVLGHRTKRAELEPSAPGPPPAHNDGYHLARRVRMILGLVADPLGRLDTLLAEHFDVAVTLNPLATSTLQAVAVRSLVDDAAAIVLNPTASNMPPAGTTRARLVNRVSICHELCHVLFDVPKDKEAVADVVFDDQIGEGQTNSPVEQRAGAFAAEFLIPLFGLRKLLGDEGRQIDTPQQAEEMVDLVRRHFCTPTEIAINHLYNHAYVAKVPAFREDLIASAKTRDVTHDMADSDTYDGWKTVAFRRAQEAHEADLITDGMARAFLGVEPGSRLPWELDEP